MVELGEPQAHGHGRVELLHGLIRGMVIGQCGCSRCEERGRNGQRTRPGAIVMRLGQPRDPDECFSYIEEFWYESYLSHSDPVVLALNPFFVLECVSYHP